MLIILNDVVNQTHTSDFILNYLLSFSPNITSKNSFFLTIGIKHCILLDSMGGRDIWELYENLEDYSQACNNV